MMTSSLVPKIGLLGIILLLAGCATDVAAVEQAARDGNCQRADAVVRDAQAQLAAIRAEMAATRIAAAKQEADLLELRRAVKQLRAAKGRVRKTDAESRHAIEALQAELGTLRDERDQLAQETTALHAQVAKRSTTEPGVVAQAEPRTRHAQDQMKALEASVVALSTQLQQLKQNGDSAIIVKRGDTLFKLARQYDVTVKQIQAANGLDSDLIRVGQRLWIPAGILANSRR